MSSSWMNEVNRISNTKSNIANVIKSKGVTIPDGAKINEYPNYIDMINIYDRDYSVTLYKNNMQIASVYALNGKCHKSFSESNCQSDNIWIGKKITDASCLVSSCYNLTGSPVCGPNVTDMGQTYANCINLTGSPVCGDKVTNMYGTYTNCYNLTGSPVCGPNVTNLSSTYSFCYNLTGSPVCGDKVTNMYGTYTNCYNLAGNGYFYSPNIANITKCFTGRNTSRRLNLYVPAGSTTLTTCLTNNTKSLVGANITWTQSGSNYYNTQFNIYLYPTL